jgi:hypothetical protein
MNTLTPSRRAVISALAALPAAAMVSPAAPSTPRKPDWQSALAAYRQAKANEDAVCKMQIAAEKAFKSYAAPRPIEPSIGLRDNMTMAEIYKMPKDPAWDRYEAELRAWGVAAAIHKQNHFDAVYTAWDDATAATEAAITGMLSCKVTHSADMTEKLAVIQEVFGPGECRDDAHRALAAISADFAAIIGEAKA